jgi:hypothetical protein
MAESVDALVSNTSGAIRAGSIPALGTLQEKEAAEYQLDTVASFLFKGKISKSFYSSLWVIISYMIIVATIL